MSEKLDKIAEEYAEIFKMMGWKWKSSTFIGIPTKNMIARKIRDTVRAMEKIKFNTYISCGRIFVMKYCSKEPEGTCSEYFICLDPKPIQEEDII